MFRFLMGLIKLKLALLFVALVIYLLIFPPEQRSGRLREVGAGALRGIEDLAGKGREALADSDREAGTHDNAEPTVRHVLPDDFRRELAAAVRRLDVVRVTERWQAIEYSIHATGRDPQIRVALVREAVSLAALFRRDAWQVDGRSVPMPQLEESLIQFTVAE